VDKKVAQRARRSSLQEVNASRSRRVAFVVIRGGSVNVILLNQLMRPHVQNACLAVAETVENSAGIP
jgi:hypothetical protein